MKLIIDIPEKMYHMINAGFYDYGDMNIIIRNGILLPKGHGRILDEKDILDTENNNGGWYDLVDMPEYIAGVKAIIEADKAERSEE